MKKVIDANYFQDVALEEVSEALGLKGIAYRYNPEADCEEQNHRSLEIAV